MFDKVLVANRGEIACRIQRTLRSLGVTTVAVAAAADRHARHVLDADQVVRVGPWDGTAVGTGYLDAEAIVAAATTLGVEAIHPGYGFLSERAELAEACEAAGIAFIGPTPNQLRWFGRKHTSRELAVASRVPVLEGTGLLRSTAEALTAAGSIGYPVMVKSTAGGGGIGMGRCDGPDQLADVVASVQALSTSHFADGAVFVERYVPNARHVEVQIFGDGVGGAIALGDRDCSVQRRNQKVIEEAPAPGLTTAQRAELAGAAVRLARSVDYRSAGTVEFVLDVDLGSFAFLEVNTRLQVEHPVTEAVLDIDLVEWMVRLASGELPALDQLTPTASGHAVEARIYAEDPGNGFRPSTGTIQEWQLPAGVRVDGWPERGTEVTPHFDPMLAKVIATGYTRQEALNRLAEALDQTRIGGVETNVEYLRAIVDSCAFRSDEHTTRFLDGFRYRSDAVDVLAGGTHTTVQDLPGRLGYWAVGVPPSGPMDGLALQLANRLAGNPAGAAALEVTLGGPELRFRCATVVGVAGTDLGTTLDGEPVPPWSAVAVPAGGVLRCGTAAGPGARAYVAVRGGFDVAVYLGSRSTFDLGRFGGHAGRTLQAGDVLHLDPDAADTPAPAGLVGRLDPSLIPEHNKAWDIAVLPGPHGSPDFLTEAGMDAFFAADWGVHYNSNRTGVRLIGPTPGWARDSGGEAGLHPSNIHDTTYAVGAIDLTGDMPVILGPDGPSLGGFVCPATIARADLWKVGQLRAGDTVRFNPITHDEAVALERTQLAQLKRAAPLAAEPFAALARPTTATTPTTGGEVLPAALRAPFVLRHVGEQPGRPEVTYRRSGDDNVLVEYGPMVLDLALRVRVHLLQTWLEQHPVDGITELSPGIRCLQVRFDPQRLDLDEVLDLLVAAEGRLPATEEAEVPSRIVHLPLSWDDPATRWAIERYAQLVRKDAPWCPSNIEFIRRINGLDSPEDVQRIVFDASYLVLGLGDVYLGAPVATPLDPRHRLVTTKYNPARTWTPENAVGIGGAYLCVYGMEGPGGYQFVGRTAQMWNRFKETADFPPGTPWLLRLFDQIRFYPVSADELLRLRDDFTEGRFRLEVQQTKFKLADHQRFLADNAASIDAFQGSRQAAFDQERHRWAASGQDSFHFEEPPPMEDDGDALPEGSVAIASPVHGSVWRVLVAEGDDVAAGDTVAILESMKMETRLLAPADGQIVSVRAVEGREVRVGHPLFALAP